MRDEASPFLSLEMFTRVLHTSNTIECVRASVCENAHTRRRRRRRLTAHDRFKCASCLRFTFACALEFSHRRINIIVIPFRVVVVGVAFPIDTQLKMGMLCVRVVLL